MDFTEVNLGTLREETLAKIRVDVQRAYANRRLVNFHLTIHDTDEAMAEAKKLKSLLDAFSHDKVMEVELFCEKPYQATVTSSHEYRDLLTEACHLLVSEGYFQREDIPGTVEAALQHEFQHHVPALGYHGLEICYGVEFVEDPKQDIRAIRPFIGLSGIIPVAVYRDAIAAVTAASATDKIQNA